MWIHLYFSAIGKGDRDVYVKSGEHWYIAQRSSPHDDWVHRIDPYRPYCLDYGIER